MSSYISRRHLGKRARPNYVCYHCNRSLGSWESSPLFLSLRTGLEVLKVKIKKRYNLCLNLSKKTISKRRFLRKNIFIIFFFSIGHADLELDNFQKLSWQHVHGLMKPCQNKWVEIGHIVCYQTQKDFHKKKPSEGAIGKKLSMSYLYYYCINFVQMTIWYGLNMAP